MRNTICVLVLLVAAGPIHAGPPIRGHDCRVWQEAPRHEHPWPGPMAYDSSRRVTVLVGAESTWEYDGTRWERYKDPGPSWSAQPNAIAFDAARDVTVVFESYIDDEGRGMSRTWEWNGHGWIVHDAIGPVLRQAPVLAYNPRVAAIVLFGGHFVEAGTTDMWVWNGGGWIKQSYTPGGPDVVMAMGYDSARNQFLVFGYSWDGGQHRETWELSNQWLYHGSTGPLLFPEEYSFVGGNRLFMIGECSPTNCREIWEWSGAEWERLPPDEFRTPSGTWRSFCYDSDRDAIVSPGIPAYGEYNGYISVDTWEWTDGAWRLAQTTGPLPRYGHALTYDPERAASVMFGGYSSGFLADTWYWDGLTWGFMNVGGPSPRWLHTMAQDTGRGKTVLFGGLGSHGQVAKSRSRGDTWEWNGVYWPGSFNFWVRVGR